jgi:hypothetical protein
MSKIDNALELMTLTENGCSRNIYGINYDDCIINDESVEVIIIKDEGKIHDYYLFIECHAWDTDDGGKTYNVPLYGEVLVYVSIYFDGRVVMSIGDSEIFDDNGHIETSGYSMSSLISSLQYIEKIAKEKED